MPREPIQETIVFTEVPLSDVAPNGKLRDEFLRVHNGWIENGIKRWISRLIWPDAPWPVSIVVAENANNRGRWLGAIVGVWAPYRVARFDDFLEQEAPHGLSGEDRPEGGYWHLITDTVDADTAGLKIGRKLAAEMLDRIHQRDSTAKTRTLSPVINLADYTAKIANTIMQRDRDRALLRSQEDFSFWTRQVSCTLATKDGKPALPIMQLHLEAGAFLEQILMNSRADELRSSRVNLRFAYPMNPDLREQQRQFYYSWVERRANAIAAGKGLCIDKKDNLYLLSDFREDNICRSCSMQCTGSSSDSLPAAVHVF